MSDVKVAPQAQKGCCGGRAEFDGVLEAGVESFPASDPPAWTSGEKEEQPSAGGCCCSKPPAPR